MEYTRHLERKTLFAVVGTLLAIACIGKASALIDRYYQQKYRIPVMTLDVLNAAAEVYELKGDKTAWQQATAGFNGRPKVERVIGLLRQGVTVDGRRHRLMDRDWDVDAQDLSAEGSGTSFRFTRYKGESLKP